MGASGGGRRDPHRRRGPGQQALEEGAQECLARCWLDGEPLRRAVRHAAERRRAERLLVEAQRHRATAEVAAATAHHLNNVLLVILGRTELLLRQAQEPAVRQALGIVERAARTGGDALRRLQDLTGQVRPEETSAVDPNRLVGEALELTRALWHDAAQLRGTRIEAVAELDEVPPVLGQPGLLREALVHVLRNAIEALPAGGRIRLRTWTDGVEVLCTVSDTGLGMTDEVRRRALTPFFTTKGPPSAGLGLALAVGIVRRHGGDIALDSSAERGTTVTIRLPAAAPAPASPTPAPAGPLTILLIDDDPEVRAVFADLLGAEGHVVIQASSGRGGLARLEAGEVVDLVLTDLGMAGMTGWDVARAVKTRWPHLPVGLVTGWGERVWATAEDRSRVDLVISKPFSADTLRSALARIRPPRPR